MENARCLRIFGSLRCAVRHGGCFEPDINMVDGDLGGTIQQGDAVATRFVDRKAGIGSDEINRCLMAGAFEAGPADAFRRAGDSTVDMAEQEVGAMIGQPREEGIFVLKADCIHAGEANAEGRVMAGDDGHARAATGQSLVEPCEAVGAENAGAEAIRVIAAIVRIQKDQAVMGKIDNLLDETRVRDRRIRKRGAECGAAVVIANHQVDRQRAGGEDALEAGILAGRAVMGQIAHQQYGRGIRVIAGGGAQHLLKASKGIEADDRLRGLGEMDVGQDQKFGHAPQVGRCGAKHKC